MATKVKIRCGSSDCASNLHCYQLARRLAAKKTRKGVASDGGATVADRASMSSGRVDRVCRECGECLVDWRRLGRRSLRDAEYTIAALKTEMIRHHYWKHVRPSPRAVNYARRKGINGMRDTLAHHLQNRIGDAHPYRDGWQTPYDGDGGSSILAYAQHATASCCRKCIEQWHGVPQGVPLPPDVLGYLSELALRYVRHLIPDLAVEGRHVPPIRSPLKRR